MRQRLGVAQSLLADPELLILDEPTNGLDPAGIREFRHMIRGFVDEGRTVLLSSHLLDEVEKICDAVAIVDLGRVVAQGPIDAIAADGASGIVVGSGEPERALSVVSGHAAVCSAERLADGLRLTLHSDVERDKARADINRRLVEAGIAVHRFEPVTTSLEQRFLEITSRLEAA